MNKQITEKNIVGLKELRENMDQYISRVDKGESFTVMRKSTPVFRLTPVDDEDGWESVVDFTQIKREGVSARDVLRALKELHGKN
jgi:prevent-host-death family protein